MERAIIDEISLNNHLEKLICLVELEQENIEKINNKLTDITNYYQTENTNKIIESNNLEQNNLKIIKQNNQKYITVINYTISKYKETQLKSEKILEDI